MLINKHGIDQHIGLVCVMLTNKHGIDQHARLVCVMLRNKHSIDQHVAFAQVNTIMHAFYVYVYAILFAVN